MLFSWQPTAAARSAARGFATFGNRPCQQIAGPANIRFGLQESLAFVHEAIIQCFNDASRSQQHLGPMTGQGLFKSGLELRR